MKERLLDSLRELMNDKPLDKITVRQIAEHSGVTTQTFYNHFSDKYEIVHWAYKRRVDRLLKELVEDRLTIRGFLMEYLADYKENARYILNAVANTRGEDSYNTRGGMYLCTRIDKTLCSRIEKEELSKEYKLLIMMWVSGFTNLINFWLDNEDENISLDEMVDVFEETVPQKLKDLYTGKEKIEK